MRKLLLILTSMFVLVGTAVTGVGPAAAQTTAQVYIVHAVPGVAVDVYVNGDLNEDLTAFAPESVAGPLALPGAMYDIAVYAADTAPVLKAADRTDEPAAEVAALEVVAGTNVSIVAHLDAAGTVAVAVFENNVAELAIGKGRVTVRHTAQAPAVDVLVDDAAALTNLTNGTGQEADLDVGTVKINVAATGTTTKVLPADLDLAVTAGMNTIAYAIGNVADSFKVITQAIEVPTTAPTVATSATLADVLASSDYKAEYAAVLRLYNAFFDRAPDVGGAKYWLGLAADGTAIDAIAANFASANQPEFVNAYKDIAADDYDAYVTKVYQNILDRDPDASGLAYWSGLMEDGSLTRGGVVRWIAGNQEFIANTPYAAPAS